MLAACAPLRHQVQMQSGSDALPFWSQAVQADTSGRSRLLAEARERDDGWRVAMLRSLPGPDYLGAGTSQSTLRTLLREGLAGDREALARMRIEELSQLGRCQGEATALRGTVSELQSQARQMRSQVERIVNIEQQIEDAP